jgi:hypothetical protein
MKPSFRALFASISILLGNALTLHAATITWTNTVSGGWNAATNWSPNTVPGGADTAVISVPGVTVSLQGGTSAGAIVLGGGGGATTLSLANQTLTLNGALSVNAGGSFTIDGGTLAGASQATLSGLIGWTGGALAGTFTISSNSVLTIAGGNGNNDMNGTLITNYGTVNWASGTLRCGNSAEVYNYGTWDAQSDHTAYDAFGGSASIFNNFGVFRKSGGASEFTSSTVFAGGVVFNQLAGVLDVQNGTNGLELVLQGGGNFTGGYITTNQFGLTVLSQGNFNINGTVTGTNTWEDAGDLVGINVINGSLTWIAGTWSGATMTISSNSSVLIDGGTGNNDMNGTALTNNGTVEWVSGVIRMGNAALIVNNSLWDCQSDEVMYDAFGGSASLFENIGVFRKSIGSTTSSSVIQPGVIFNNTGTVDTRTGSLVLQGGGAFTGGAVTAAPGITVLSEGNFIINGTTTTTNVIENAANLVGTNVIVGGLNWQAGTWSSAIVTITAGATVIVDGGNGNNDMNGAVITNNGSFQWASGTLRVGNGAQIYNNGLWDAQSDQTIVNAYGGSGSTFYNYGNFRKSGGQSEFTNSTVFGGGVLFDQLAGVVDVQNGTNGLALVFQGGANLTGGYITTNKSGLTVLSQGNFNINGTVTGTNTWQNAGNLVSSNFINGALTWIAGTWSSAYVTVSPNSTVIIEGGNQNNDLNGSVINNNGTVLWLSGTLRTGNGGVINNNSLWVAACDQSLNNAYGGSASAFNNIGTLRKTVGAATNSTVVGGGVVFNQLAGEVDIQSGNFVLQGDGNFTGGYVNYTPNGFTVLSIGNFLINGTVTTSNVIEDAGNLVGSNIINGALTWTAGTWDGAFVNILSNSTVFINGNSGNGLNDANGAQIVNSGVVAWQSGTIRVGNGATINNRGVWLAQSDQSINGAFGGSSSTFNNTGTFRKTLGASTNYTVISIVFNQLGGEVDIQNGNLVLQGSGSLTGGFVNYTPNGYTVLSEGNFLINGTMTASNVIENSANLIGSNYISGALVWQAGYWDGSTVTVGSNSVVVINGGTGNSDINSTAINNYGTVAWQDGTLRAGNGATIDNYGLWIAQSDQTLNDAFGGSQSSFNNSGTFRKTAGVATNQTLVAPGVFFSNTGLIDIKLGNLVLQGSGSFTGGQVAANPGAVVLNQGNFTIDGTITTTNVIENSASLIGTNVIQGAFTWQAGSWNGALVTINPNSTVVVAGSGNIDLNSATVTNNGTLQWTSGTIRLGNGAQVFNNGLWDAQSDQTMNNAFGGSSSTFNNLGTFRKSVSGGGSTQIQNAVNFVNQGTLDSEAGNISLSGSYNFAAGTTEFGITSAQTFGSISIGGAVTLSGFAKVNFNNGYVPASGTQFQLLNYGSRNGSFDTSQLPLGMAFNYSPSAMTLVVNGINSAAWGGGSSALHGSHQITLLVAPNTTVQLIAITSGKSYPLATATGSGIITLSYNTAQLPNGPYTLRLVLTNSSGQTLGDYSKPAFVNNSLQWHEGTLTTNEVWGTNEVNAVDQTIVIPSGVTLTIAPGAIVKFADGTGIIIQSGGTLDAGGATQALPIIFTSLEDDTAGGDSNLDGNSTTPTVGDWNGISVFGQFHTATFVQLRYVIQTHSGTLTSSEEWTATMEHIITGNIVVPTNLTLTIDPGAIVKFNAGLNLKVQPGGALIAVGNVAQPIIFTSIKDTSVGVNTNSIATIPAAGDWDSIYINGGTATFDHVQISYGGGPDSLNSGLISLIGPGSVVNVSDSILKEGFYKGIDAEYGTVNASNCVVIGSDRGIQSGLSGPTTVNAVNCTLEANNNALFAHGGVLNVINSIIADSQSGGLAFCCGSSISTFEHNDVWSATSGFSSTTFPVADQTGMHGNISVNPLFIDASLGNYQLGAASPCIDAADSKAAPLTDILGNPTVNDPAVTHKTGIANSQGKYRDIGAYEFVQNATSDVDLVANSVFGPLQATSGQSVSLTWNDVNIGTGTAAGPWKDSVYLVGPNGTNLAGTVVVAQNTRLGAGKTYGATATVVVPSVAQGTYQWEVQVNSEGTVFEGGNYTNNFATAASSTLVATPPLVVGASNIVNQFTSAGQSSLYALLDTGGAFVVTVQGNTPNCALAVYVGDGYVPTPSSYDEASSQFNSAFASVTVPGVLNHTYYVLVYATSLNTASVSYTLSAIPVAFQLNSVTPSSIANSGSVTLQISGNNLSAFDAFSLVGPGGTFSAISVQSPDGTVAYATFNLNGATAGAYTLTAAQPGSQTISLPNAVAVSSSSVVAPVASLSVQLQVPSDFRTQRQFNGSIDYENTGNIDMPSPILILTSKGVAATAIQGDTNLLTSDLLLVGASFQGPAGILSPGQTWSIPFVAISSSSSTIPFAVNYELATATNLVDYRSLQSSFRPAGYTAAQWNLIWPAFQAQAGPTWGGLVALVDSYATEMQLQNAPGTFYRVQDVLSFAFDQLLQQASANVFGTLYLSDTNHPLAEAALTFADASGGTNGGGAVSTHSGAFSAAGVPPGTYTVSVPGYYSPSPATITVPASGTLTGLSIVVQPGGAISGTISNGVYSASTALILGITPFLTNVTVEALGGNGESYTTFSDQFGYYSFSGIEPDTYRVSEIGTTLFAGTVAPTTLQFPAMFATHLVVSNGASLVQNFLVQTNTDVIQAQVFVTNTVTPIPGATATATVAPGVNETNIADETAHFSFPANPGDYQLRITAPGYVTFYGAISATLVGSSPPPVYLIPASSLMLTFTNSSGGAISNATIILTLNGGNVAIGATDVNGRVAFTNLAPGTYGVVENAYGYQQQNATVQVGLETTSSNSFTAAQAGGIVGTVTDGNGVPISGMDVNVYGIGAANGSTAVLAQTDTNGTYSALGLPAGPYAVSVGNLGGVDPQTTTLVSTEQRIVNFTLKASVVTGSVVAADGVTPVPSATVSLSQGGHIVNTATTRPNGAYTFRVFIPGTYNLAASTISGLSSSGTVTVSDSSGAQASPLLLGSLSLTIKVTDFGGNLQSGASVSVYPVSGGPTVPEVFAQTAGSSGSVTFRGLVAGPYGILVHQPGFARSFQVVNFSASSAITVALATPVTLSGTVTGPGGQPATQAQVAVFDPAANIQVAGTNTDATGHYSISDLYQGTFDVVASQSGLATVVDTAVVNTNSFTQNLSLPAQSTQLSGAVKDSSGAPLSAAAIEISTANGVPLALVSPDANGAWSTAQLVPGNYSVAVVATGYKPPGAANFTLAAGAPFAISDALSVWAIDDSVIEDVSTGLGNFIKSFSDEEAPTFQRTPGIPTPGDCDKARAAAAAAKKAQSLMTDNYITWLQLYQGTSEALGGTGGIAIVQSLQLAADTLAQFSWVGKSGAQGIVGNLSAAEQFTVGGVSGANIVSHLTVTLVDLQNNLSGVDWTSSTSVFQFAAATQADLISNGLDVQTLIALKNNILANPASPLAIYGDSINLALTLWQGVNDFTAALGADESAKFAYDVSVARYRAAVQAVNDANIDCPPPKPPQPPTPPNPNPGPNQQVNNTRSSDPNAKFATGVGVPGWIGPKQAITYTVEFENMPTASAAAQTVSITDPLDANLDWSTVQLTAIGFNNVTISIPPGVQKFSTNVHVSTDPNPVAVSASLNPTNGVITWFMESINPATGQLVTDPNAGFLPPDKTKHQGEGYVVYTVLPKNSLATGAQITNQANIVFDVNAAILTPKTTNSIDITAPTSAVNALPVDSAPSFTVSWSGTDAGSGIQSYNIYASTNGGPWGGWLLGTTNKSGVFQGVLSNTYAFYSVAFDKVGNQQPSPGKAQAQTTVYIAGLPIITQQPSNQVAALGGSATFTVAALGKAPLTYQWFKNGVKLPNGHGVTGATTATLKISPVAAANGGTYSVLVANKLGSIASSNAILTLGPGVSITSPANKSISTNGLITVKGLATDASGPGLSQVLWQLNGGAFQTATGTSNWTASVALTAGTNIFAVKSIDNNGLQSSLATSTFIFEVFQPITLVTNGQGTITLTPNLKQYLIGATYKATATAKRGAKFSGWTGSTNSTSNPLTFTMRSNMVLQANFTTNAPAVAKIYRGLFYPTNGPTQESSGFITVTVSASDSAAYSAKIMVNGLTHSFTGEFDNAGASHTQILRAGLPTLDVNLSLSPDSGKNQLTGSISTTSQTTWLSTIVADRALSADEAALATNYSGDFALVVPAAPVTGAPLQFGRATLSNTSSGVSTLTGTLSDGTPITWSVPLAADGTLPLYQSLYSGKGCLLGWITPGDSAQNTGEITWIKPAASGSPAASINLFQNITLRPLPNTQRGNNTLTAPSQ